ncbi:MAG TPA: AMP-binding protein [Polyangiaceae bacterium]
MNARTLAGLLRTRADDAGDELGVRFHEGGSWVAWTWAEYWEQARRVAVALHADGMRPGDRVLLLAPDVRAAVAGHFGAWALGAIPTHVGLPYRLTDPGAFIEQLRATARSLDASTLLVSRTIAPFAQRREGERLLVIEDLLEANVAGDLPHPDEVPAPPLVQLTSGSTGHPRAVVVPHERLVRHLANIAHGLPAGDRATGVTWLPLYHDMGLIGGLLYPFATRFPVNVLSPMAFQARPYFWLEVMSEVGATHTVGPPSAYAILLRVAAKAAEANLRLDRLRCAMIGAEPISALLLRRFADAFAPCGFAPEAFFPVYGLAEATVAVTFPAQMAPTRIDRVDRALQEREGRAEPPASFDSAAIENVGVGAPLRDTEVRVVDGAGHTLPDRRVGEVLVRSATLMTGYHREPEATAAAIRDGWLMTGDLGYVADGALFVVGRSKDVIIKGGHNMLPEPIEEIAGTVEGVRAGCVAAVGVRVTERETERAVVVAETKVDPAGHAVLAERVREALKANGISVDEVLLVSPGALPKTTSGKVRRRAVAEALAAGRSPGAES